MRERLETLAKARTRACSPLALATAFSSRALSRIVTRACALSLAALFAMPAVAEEATVTGGLVEFFGAETNWLNGTELLLKFTGEGSFVLHGQTKARILAIGGGGGGGGICTASAAMTTYFGAGGGGGGGGFIETNDIFSAATYSVVVGEGGSGGASSSTHTTLRGRYTGKSGGNTTVSIGTSELLSAVGGGGGGGEGDGLAGGSGGGGSAYRSGSSSKENHVGGDGVEGQGFAGGSGTVGLYGGGGGGANGTGAAASTKNPVGGDGLPSDITGETLYYAGGGGGGYCNKSYTSAHDPIAGGNGGGGNGGYGLNVPCTDATAYGGGGGGSGALAANATTPGGSGYQGVVYVRIFVVAVDEIVKPTDLAVNFDGKEHVLVPWNAAYKITDMTEGSATYGQVVERVAGTEFGTYKAKVTLVDGFKWPDGTDGEVNVTLTISKATPVISNLSIRDWIFGTPEEATPNPGCDVSIAVVPTYWYGESATGPWKAEKPTAAGEYWLRAYIEGTDSYNEAEAFAQFKVLDGPGDIYRDYVEIAVDGLAVETNDFTYVLKLSEGNPVGFLYSRAGSTGDDLAITDADGAPLDYKAYDWNVSGESTLWIKLPTLSTAGETIRLFWCVRDGKEAPPHGYDVAEPSGAQPGCSFDLVVRDGKRVNYWLTYPSLSKTKWDSEGDTPGTVDSVGTVREGTSELLYVTNLNTGAISPAIVSEGGSYSAVFGPHDPAGDYEPMEYAIDYVVIGHVTYDDLWGEFDPKEFKDALTKNGRVLLANDDGAPGGFSVYGQSYCWQKNNMKYSTYWTHAEDHDVTDSQYPYLKPYLNHVLYSIVGSDTNTLWTLNDVIIGSTYSLGPAPSETGCYLPNSSTAKAISSESAAPGLAEQGTMAMRNKIGSVILSPVYTNGVGTIYFDAVNAYTTYAKDGDYKIKVEVSLDAGTNWTEYAMLPFKRENTAAFVPDQTGTRELALEITAGGTDQNFYRVAVPVNSSESVQFRIVRSSYVSIWKYDTAFILVDNILVSYPKSTASLVPYGSFDKDRTGRQVLGWAASMTEPFPAVGAKGVYARAKAIVETNANAHVAVDMPITWAQMHYRWRYLTQLTNEWRTISLRPTASFMSTQPMDLFAKEGDVEFWYDYIVQVPAYKYHDYSGESLDLKDASGNALYSEDVTASTNNQLAVTGYKTLASGGTDWFFRLRRGASDFESFTIYAKESEDGEVVEYPMSLSGNHMWRGFCPTRKEIEGGLLVRIAGRNRQTPGSEDYDLGMVRYSLAKSAFALPATDILSEKSDDDSWEWFAVPCDARSGQVMIQLQDDTLAYTVVHADYQDFNGWTDANKTDGKGLFVGTSTDTNSTSMAGTTAEAKTYQSHFDGWKETIATNAYWSESFYATKAELDKGAWPLYQPFESTVSPNTGFTVGPGQWVNGYYRDNNTGMALQMEGKGKGYIQLVNAAQSPRGLESVSFKARVAQAIDFGDFCYYMTDPTSLANYTFMTAASFDVNSRKDFAGNASLSLVALYTPGVGCYEFRVEQETATVNAAGAVSPGNQFRLSLYRWTYDEEQEEVVPTLIGATSHSNGSNMFDTKSESGNYAILFISVDTTSEPGRTRVVGGVSRTSPSRANFFSSLSYREVMIRDTDANGRLKTGTYGLLSANCPAHFMQMAYNPSPIAYPTYGSATTKEGFQYGTTASPSTIAPIPAGSSTAAKTACRTAISDGKWAIKKGRMTPVNSGDPDTYGINAVIPETTVDIYTAKEGTTVWTNKISYTVSGFGSSTESGALTTVNLYSLTNCSVQIRAGGTAKTARKDVVVDDIYFRQWRGENYDSDGQTGAFDPLDYGAYTNIVFTQGWVRKGVDSANNPRTTCLLSARRSFYDVATSIRSPRMVSEDNKTGLGLGAVTFTYENAQSNAVVLVQIATNAVSLGGFAGITESVSPGIWTTVTNIDFSAMSAAERAEGSVSVYLGLHGAMGAMRIALDPATAVSVAKVMDPTAFGEVTITGVAFRDEPMLDKYSWWGWNLRTTKDESMRSLVDNANDPLDAGLSLGLNNSVTEDIRVDDPGNPAEQYRKKLPFVQTPTFATNLVNEVSFMARLYSTNDAAARVTLYGATSGDVSVESEWRKLTSWDVTNATYEAYSKKFGPGNYYTAFRLAVTGVDGVEDPMEDLNPLKPAVRVLIDEVLVMEGILASVAFRNVGAFRSGLDTKTAVPNVPSPEQQPLVGEEWGVQCEVYASQLVDEIDLSSAKVRLWWYDKDVPDPWGADNWKDLSGAKSALLAPAADSNLVFRSGYFVAPSAVVPARLRPAVVQYTLSVEYKANGQWQTNWLSSAEWPTPSWYRPLDYNAGRGSFSAYTILDTVAPGWAWINEVNLFGKYDDNYINSDKPLQFVEVAAPASADLSGWKIRFLEAQMAGSPVKLTGVVTNDIAEFGMDIPSTKAGLKGIDVDSKMVFHVVGSPNAKGSLDPADGRLDGTWKATSSKEMMQTGEIMAYYPLAVQLVRSSGIIDSEIVAIGTNAWAYVSSYNPEAAAKLLSAQESQGNFVYVGMDSHGAPVEGGWSRSLGVFAGTGESDMQWGGESLMSPGRINDGQVITGQAPEPRGSALVIYSLLQGDCITQTFGESVDTNASVTLVYRKDAEEGTNITYRTAPWHEIGPVTVNGVAASPVATGNPREWTLSVGKAASSDITVVASAQVDSSLADRYGVAPDNRYRNAIVKWLMRGTRADGVTPWHDPDATELGLADIADTTGSVEDQMTLTEMYWFDVDPTWPDHAIMLKAGWTKVPTPKGSGDDVHSCRVFMQFSNTVDNTAWAPYVLQGVDFANNSWEYAKDSSDWTWTNATFKVAGLLPVNGLNEDVKDPRNWASMRRFVFAEGSFDSDFTSYIEFADPFSIVPSWRKWKQEHGADTPNPVFKWSVDERGWSTEEVEVMKKSNQWPLY